MELQPWEFLLKNLVWKQLDFIDGKKVLDFGSGHGVTASHFAKNNQVVAVEPSEEMLLTPDTENDYIQIKGGIESLRELETESFDVILCHNVLGRHTAAVVGDPKEGHAAVPDLYGHLAGAGIHCVFQQLLDDGGRTLHHLTGGDQIGNMLGKLNDLRHRITSMQAFRWR